MCVFYLFRKTSCTAHSTKSITVFQPCETEKLPDDNYIGILCCSWDSGGCSGSLVAKGAGFTLATGGSNCASSCVHPIQQDFVAAVYPVCVLSSAMLLQLADKPIPCTRKLLNSTIFLKFHVLMTTFGFCNG